MRVTSDEETLQAKESYEHLAETHGARFCAYRADNGIFLAPLFKEEVQTCGQHISYYGVVHCQVNPVRIESCESFLTRSEALMSLCVAIIDDSSGGRIIK